MESNATRLMYLPRFVLAAVLGTVLWAGVPSVHAEPPAGSATERGGAPALIVNLNTATSAELEQLPGIGPAKARAILELRERIGRYRRIAQILRVRGVGRATFRKLRPMLTVDDPSKKQ